MTSYECGNLGGHGDTFQRSCAEWLLCRCSLEKIDFRLALEMKQAFKFDDIALNLPGNVWCLMQLKHYMEHNRVLNNDMLFPADNSDKGDFAILKYLKSSLQAEDSWPYGGVLKFFLITNKVVDGTVEYDEVRDVDQLLNFPNSKAIRLKYSDAVLAAMNSEFRGICDAIKKLFAGQGMDGALHKYKKPLSKVLVKSSSNSVVFSEEFTNGALNSDWRMKTLYECMQKHFGSVISTISVKASKDMSKFWSITQRDTESLLPLVGEQILKDFFDNFVLLTNVDNVDVATANDLYTWMKSWVRPDVLGSLSKSRLSDDALKNFKNCFADWEKPNQPKQTQTFLTLSQGENFLGKVKDAIEETLQLINRQTQEEMDALEKHYIHRQIKGAANADGDCIQLEDDEFVKELYTSLLNQPCMILSAEPGMGKSTVWQYLAFRAQKMYPEVTVFLLFLNEFKAETPAVKSLSDVANFIPKKVLSREHIKIIENEHEPILVFLDAFDELNSSNTAPVLEFVNVLKARGNAKILISTRERTEGKLRSCLSVEPLKLVPFQRTSRENFLKMFWKVGVQDMSKFETFSRKLLDELPRNVPVAAFTGFPLTMKMLAAVHHKEYEKWIESGKEISNNPPLNIVNLYGQFISLSIDLQISKECKIDIHDDHFKERFGPSIKLYEREYQLLALSTNFDEYFPSEIIDEIFEKDLNSALRKFRNGIVKPLLVKVINGEPQFTHRSYAEYFIARYLLDYIDKVKKIETCVRVIYRIMNWTMNHFFLLMIEFTDPTEQHFQKRFDFVAAMGKYAAFWLCKYDCINLVRHLSQIYDYKKLESCLFSPAKMIPVAVLSNAVQTLEFLVQTNVSVIDDKDDILDIVLYYACRLRHMRAAEILLDAGACINASNVYHRSPLACAILNGDVEMVQLLCHRGADVNLAVDNEEMNENKWSPLHLAAYWGNVKIAALLLEHGANINAVCDEQNTALQLAQERGHSEIERLIIERKLRAIK